MTDERLDNLAKIVYKKPEMSWEKRKQKIYEDLEVIIKIFKEHTDDREYIEKLEELEAKFK